MPLNVTIPRRPERTPLPANHPTSSNRTQQLTRRPTLKALASSSATHYPCETPPIAPHNVTNCPPLFPVTNEITSTTLKTHPYSTSHYIIISSSHGLAGTPKPRSLDKQVATPDSSTHRHYPTNPRRHLISYTTIAQKPNTPHMIAEHRHAPIPPPLPHTHTCKPDYTWEADPLPQTTNVSAR
jgi:hypothetical protein